MPNSNQNIVTTLTTSANLNKTLFPRLYESVLTTDSLTRVVQSSVGTLNCYVQTPRMPPVVSGDNSGALRFTSAFQQYARIPYEQQYTSRFFTIAAWIRPIQNSNGSYLSVINTGPINIGLSPSGDNFFCTINKAGGGTYTAISNFQYRVNRWTWVLVHYDGSFLTIYINAASDKVMTAAGEVDQTVTQDILLAQSPNGSFVDVDISKFQFWNYAITPATIPSMYTAPHRLGCLNSYISSTGAPNPFTSTQSAMVMDTPRTWKQPVYLTAGGEATKNFDTKIVIDPYNTTINFDTIVAIDSAAGVKAQRPAGYIVYPITRDHELEFNTPLKQAPIKAMANKSAYISAGHSTETKASPQYAYIQSLQNPSVAWYTLAYISSVSHPITTSIGAFIPAPSEASQSSFIYGGVPIVEQSVLDAYINADHQSVFAPRYAYIEAKPFLYSSQTAFIRHAEIDEDHILGYVCAIPVTPISNTFRMFMDGHQSTTALNRVYINGAGNTVASKQSYVSSILASNATQNCYLLSSSSYSASKLQFMAGNGVVTAGNNSYINAVPLIIATQRAYFHGLGIATVSAVGFIRGAYITTMVSGSTAYIPNYLGSSQAFNSAYIRVGPGNLTSFQRAQVGAYPSSTQLSFIKCLGTGTSVQYAYVRAEIDSTYIVEFGVGGYGDGQYR